MISKNFSPESSAIAAGFALSEDLQAACAAAIEQLGIDEHKLLRVLSITNTIFAHVPSVHVDVDPELEDEKYLVVEVRDRGSHAEIAERRRRWYVETHDEAPDFCKDLRLSISVEP